MSGEQCIKGRPYSVQISLRRNWTTFSLFGGLALALAQPALWRGLSRLVQTRVAQGGSQSDMAQWLLRPELRDTAQTLGFVLMGLFAIASVVIAWLQWTGRG